jgi:Family of unknown function (DUF5906)
MTDIIHDNSPEGKIIRLNKLRENSLSGEQARRLPPNVSSTAQAIDWLNADHFKALIKGKFKVVREQSDGDLDIMDVKDFIANHQEWRLEITDEFDKKKSTPATEIWLKSPSARKYENGLTFDPSFVGHRNGKYNLFKGWKLGAGIAGDVAPWQEFVKNTICSGDEENFAFLEALIADMFQRPHLKPGVTVVIRGDEGVGKSFYVEHLSALAAPYCFKTSNPSYVFGDHNGQLRNKLLLHLEEAVWPGGKKTESLLKDLITSPTIPINDKFVPVYEVPNHLHLFLTGNPDWLAHASLKARRIFALHASDEKRNDTKYFEGLDEWFKNGGAEALLHHYLNHKSDINLRKVPVTEELIFQKEQSFTPLQEWLISIAETLEMPFGEIQPDGSVRVIKQLLYIDYLNSPMGKRQPLSPVRFGDQFLAMLPVVVDGIEQKAEKGRRVRTVVKTENIKIRDNRQVRRDGYEIPNFKIVRECLEFRLGGKKVWVVDGDEVDHDDQNKEMERRWRVLRENSQFEFEMYKPESTRRY